MSNKDQQSLATIMAAKAIEHLDEQDNQGKEAQGLLKRLDEQADAIEELENEICELAIRLKHVMLNTVALGKKEEQSNDKFKDNSSVIGQRIDTQSDKIRYSVSVIRTLHQGLDL